MPLKIYLHNVLDVYFLGLGIGWSSFCINRVSCVPVHCSLVGSMQLQAQNTKAGYYGYKDIIPAALSGVEMGRYSLILGSWNKKG